MENTEEAAARKASNQRVAASVKASCLTMEMVEWPWCGRVVAAACASDRGRIISANFSSTPWPVKCLSPTKLRSLFVRDWDMDGGEALRWRSQGSTKTYSKSVRLCSCVCIQNVSRLTTRAKPNLNQTLWCWRVETTFLDQTHVSFFCSSVQYIRMWCYLKRDQVLQVSAGTGGIFDFISALLTPWGIFNSSLTIDHPQLFTSRWGKYISLKKTKHKPIVTQCICSYSLINQLWQVRQRKVETWLHYPATLIWNECEIVCLFEPAVLRRGPVWCFIYCHLRAQNSVNPLFVFKHLSCLLCVSLSPPWLLWAVCLAGCQWSWSGRQPAVGDDAWLQRCVTEDSRLVFSVCMAACPSVLRSKYLSVWTSFLSLPLSACLPVSDLLSIWNIFIKSVIHLASLAWFDFLIYLINTVCIFWKVACCRYNYFSIKSSTQLSICCPL